MTDHWLARPATIRNIKIISVIVLGMLLVAELMIDMHPHFGFDGIFGFNALLGFFGGLIILFGSKAIGALLKQNDTYYDQEDGA
ncbi:MAG: hypothetical protein K8F25_12220 [Fimbriimonadaceae bacterium]|nr:hypothetical protein [Alphaproteobacteria bacterium]